jgi:nitroimidazol reductase NimA-like FMN-containing flavoprotein (pyridoxamine 5'-phosphate oxidase superfamily)
MSTPGRRLEELPRDEAIELLSSVSMGRIGFTIGGLPTIRPVNHVVVDGDDIVIRTHLESTMSACSGAVVAYETDWLDRRTRTGWSVIVTGVASVVDNPWEIERFERLVQPWIDQPDTYLLRIKADVVEGLKLVAD